MVLVFTNNILLSKCEISVGSGLIKLGNIATGTEGFFALCVDHDHLDIIVLGPGIQSVFNGDAHVVGHGIQRLGAGEGDAAGLANLADIDVFHGPKNLVCIASV